MIDRGHDPGADVARQAVEGLGGAEQPVRVGDALVRFGTSSWTDPTLLEEGVFYPPEAHTPEARLRHYASRFSVVEVDSSYYALPSRRNAELWVARTPAGFAFDIKAHALMTGQPTEVSRLPADLKRALPEATAAKQRIYAKDLPPELRAQIWERFRDAIEPLHAAGKLGAVMLQYPRWVTPGDRARAGIAEAAERLDGLPCAVEFRSAAWFAGAEARGTLRFLEEHGLSYVMVDEPQGFASSVPPLAAVTAKGLAVVRLHGRRAEAWEKQGIPVVERFRYLYDAAELGEWVPRILGAAEQAREVHVLMNNCYANYGTTNALELAAMVRKAYAERD
ncbi:MAG TPA: DUF72 domain-containing protein [Gemmatimonadaceae bacterium]|nr:DUF72 domain-containing protein [Gemmatimonadaceae bacterium]